MHQKENGRAVAPKSIPLYLISLVTAVALLLLLAAPGFSQSTTVDVIPDETVSGSVELNPGYIGGTIDLGGLNINRIYLTARSTDYTASYNVPSEGSHSMTVNVPKDTSLDYTLSGYAYMDSYATRMYFKNRSTVVHEGQKSQVDIIVDSGYIAGEIITNGCTLTRSDISAILNNGADYTNTRTTFSNSNTFRIPVQPNNNIAVTGNTQLSTGKTITLAKKYVNVYPGQTTVISWEVSCVAGELSAIQNDMNYHIPMTYAYSYLYDQATYALSRYARHDGSYLFDNIAPLTWRLYNYFYWNSGRNLITKSTSNIVTTGGQTTNVIIDEYPGFLQGKVTLTGTNTMADTVSAYIYSYGRNALYASNGSTSRAHIDNATGEFNLALPQGEWNVFYSYYAFRKADTGTGSLNSSLYMYDYANYNNTMFINSNEVKTGHDLTFKTGSATIKYSRSDGGSFVNPYLNARSMNYDANGRLASYIYAYAGGDYYGDKATFVGFPGTYEVEAWAYVDGTLTTFGKATIEIVAGVEKIVDLGGPSLNIDTPQPGSVFEESTVTVSGTATDDIGVAYVTVNGAKTELASTNNPDDPNEVEFSVTLELKEGENAIETIAVDTSDNESADSRTVVYEKTSVAALIDIKPGSCKNPLNIKSNGVLPVAILGSENLDVSLIDPSSIRLEGVEALRTSIEDVNGIDCSLESPDSYLDITLKFDTQEIVSAIGSVNDGDVITLSLSGYLLDGTELTGEDTVTMLVKGKKKK
ncbi:MAG: hypothetical protein ISR96_08235 [Nitrospira sp.]|nr:hypothetical protein [Nitrospira sp.]